VDILPLTELFLDEIARSLRRAPAGVTREAKQALLGYRWPGNVRELHNVLERAAIVCEGGLIAPEHLAIDLNPQPAVSATTDLKAVERQLIEQALRECRGNKSRAAIRLGLTRKELYGRLKQYRLE
jgi:two-component system response regulator HydG